MTEKHKKLLGNIPGSPGVYLMENNSGEILYVGKAGNLRRRVTSYFARPHEFRIEKLVSQIEKIETRVTDTAIEALILEAELIKKLSPPFNVREKDDKSFLYVEITKDKFPRVLLTRGKDVNHRATKTSTFYGPFTSAGSIREALKIIRKIFPYSTHPAEKLKIKDKKLKYTSEKERLYPERSRRACFEYEIGLCPGTCANLISREDYLKNIKHIKLFFSGRKQQILKSLEKEMKVASKKLEFERASEIRRQIFALKHIQDIALISDEKLNGHSEKESIDFRIEGYDISNISGTSATGSMVVFLNGEPAKREYRKFKIRTLITPNDTGMLQEVLSRRFSRDPGKESWPLPNLILIDGGVGQVNSAKEIVQSKGLNIPIVGIAKGPERKRNDIIGHIPAGVDPKTLIQVRDEAHRFAVSYHRKLRSRRLLNGEN